MFTSFTTALSALNATSTAVNIVGNNLANLNTTGYKGITAEFSDLLSQSLGATSAANELGLGVGPTQSVRQFTQGAVQTTTGPLDAAISGQGFFVVRNSNNELLYTRAGNFQLEPSGHLQTPTGENVQGWPATDGVVNSNAPVGDIIVPMTGVLPAVPTSTMSVGVNLNSAGVVGEASGTYSAPIQVVDTQGGTHTLNVTFTKTGLNAWHVSVNIPASDLADPTASTEIGSGDLTFDPTGKILTPAITDPPITVTLTGLADGATNADGSDQVINLNLFNGKDSLVTQVAQASGVSSTNQDGLKAGQITSIGIADGGQVMAHYSNGQQVVVGMIALATIENPNTLLSVGNNELEASAQTSQPAIGAPDSGGRGKIRGMALEASNVDIATEFTNLITYQRSYQANSKVITTTDQMTQDLIGLIR